MFNEKTLHQIGFWASACCAVHCAVTPLLLVLFPLMIQIPEKWHDGFIYATLLLGLAITIRSAVKNQIYRPLAFVGLACVAAFVGHFMSSCTITDICIGIFLSIAHWFNHKVAVCKHQH